MYPTIRTTDNNLEDRRLERRVALALVTLRMPKLRFQHIHVDRQHVLRVSQPGKRSVELYVRRGAVTLAGNVLHAGEKATLGELVRRVPGVLSVIDNLRIVAPHLAWFAPFRG